MARLDPRKELRDPIHGLVHLTDQEIAIVNTPTFQRLRRIRQLAFADLVYPGAVHTRFEHSLGTLHVAHRILTRLDKSEPLCDNDVVAVRLGALLHDIGHGPFSHVSEHLLEQHRDKQKTVDISASANFHERITLDIIDADADLARCLPADQRELIKFILQGSGRPDFRRDIVASSMDADKMDYLLRDAYYAGVRYGHYDLDKVIDACRKVSSGSNSYLMVDHEGRFAVEQLVLAKHHMTQQVYAHRVRIITDAMIVRALELAIEADEAIRGVYTYDGSPEHLERYLNADDARMMAALLCCQDPRVNAIAERLRRRHLFKELALIEITERNPRDSITRMGLSNLSEEQARELEHQLAPQLRCEPWEVIVLRKSIKNPAYQPPGGLEPDAIHVIRPDEQRWTLNDYPELVVAKLPTVERLHVIAPWDPDEALSSQQRRDVREALANTATRLVVESVGGRA